MGRKEPIRRVRTNRSRPVPFPLKKTTSPLRLCLRGTWASPASTNPFSSTHVPAPPFAVSLPRPSPTACIFSSLPDSLDPKTLVWRCESPASSVWCLIWDLLALYYVHWNLIPNMEHRLPMASGVRVYMCCGILSIYWQVCAQYVRTSNSLTYSDKGLCYCCFFRDQKDWWFTEGWCGLFLYLYFFP